jgi:hypothetical protein
VAAWCARQGEAWNDGTPPTVGLNHRRQPSAERHQSAAAEQHQSSQRQLGSESGDQRSTINIMINDHPMIPALPSALLSAPCPLPSTCTYLAVLLEARPSRRPAAADAYLSRAVAAQGALQTSKTAVVVLVVLRKRSCTCGSGALPQQLRFPRIADLAPALRHGTSRRCGAVMLLGLSS